MMIKEYKHLIKLQSFPMEQMYLKCVRMKYYQKVNGMLIKLLMKINHDIGVIIFTSKISIVSDNTNKIIVSQDFGWNKYSKNIKVTIKIK